MSTHPLHFPFSDFVEGHLQRSLSIAPAELDLETCFEPARFKGPLSIAIDARHLPEGEVLVHATITYDIEQECVSCLDPIAEHREDKLEMLFSPESERPENPREAEALWLDNPDLAYHDGVTLKLDEEIPGVVLQALPEYPRCREDCKGLDPRTGKNLNRCSEEERQKLRAVEPIAEPEWKKQLRDIRLTG